MFYNIAISGGGINTLAFIGCLKYLEEENKSIHALTNYLGASGGSIMCLFMILGFTSEEIKIFLTNEIPKINTFSIWSVFRFFKQFGLNDGENIYKLINNILEYKKVNTKITFLELAKLTGKNLIISVTNVSQQKIEYLSVDNYPFMQIRTAIRMSTSIPLFFTPVRFYDDIYVDSMVFNNFPINFFNNFNNETLGLNIISTSDRKKIKTFSDYISFLGDCINQTYYKHTKTSHKYVCNIILNEAIKNINYKTLRFDFSNHKMNELILLGYTTLRIFFNETQ